MLNDEWRMTTALTRLLAVAALLMVTVPTGAQRFQPTFLGVVDEHGQLTPLAVYDGAAWWNRWPRAAESQEIRDLPLPESLAAIPADWLPPGANLPTAWQAYRAGKLVPFRALGPARSPERALMDTITIRTTYRGRSGEEDTLAIAGPGVLGRFVGLSNAEADAVLRQLAPRITTLEADALARWKQQQAAEGITDLALARTYMVRSPSRTDYVSAPPAGQERDYGILKSARPIDGRTYLYLQGEKLFTIRANDDCMMQLSTSGFVVVDRAGHVESEKIGADGFSEYCGDAGEFVYHLGTVVIGRRTWWIVKVGVEDGDDYGLIDPLTGEEIELKGLWSLRQK